MFLKIKNKFIQKIHLFLFIFPLNPTRHCFFSVPFCLHPTSPLNLPPFLPLYSSPLPVPFSLWPSLKQSLVRAKLS